MLCVSECNYVCVYIDMVGKRCLVDTQERLTDIQKKGGEGKKDY